MVPGAISFSMQPGGASQMRALDNRLGAGSGAALPDFESPGRSLRLTARQRRELAYHNRRARELREQDIPLFLDVITSRRRRWWNSYWHLYTLLQSIGVRGRRALVLGCGFGNDAILLHEMGAEVDACDISPETVKLAKSRAGDRNIRFAAMPAESLAYGDGIFDLILADDILHHIEVRESMRELERVAKAGCLFVWREVYLHSLLKRIRKSRFVERFLYLRMIHWIYGSNEPYITQDERPLSEHDIDHILQALGPSELDYFNFLIGRLFPDRLDMICKLDRLLLRSSKLGRWLGCRCVGYGAIHGDAAGSHADCERASVFGGREHSQPTGTEGCDGHRRAAYRLREMA
jgi:ubiquinone/menaquinone biosynthesis C-methylase UbiE